MERYSRVKQEYEEQAIASEQDVVRVAQIDYFISTLEKLNARSQSFTNSCGTEEGQGTVLCPNPMKQDTIIFILLK